MPGCTPACAGPSVPLTTHGSQVIQMTCVWLVAVELGTRGNECAPSEAWDARARVHARTCHLGQIPTQLTCAHASGRASPMEGGGVPDAPATCGFTRGLCSGGAQSGARGCLDCARLGCGCDKGCKGGSDSAPGPSCCICACTRAKGGGGLLLAGQAAPSTTSLVHLLLNSLLLPSVLAGPGAGTGSLRLVTAHARTATATPPGQAELGALGGGRRKGTPAPLEPCVQGLKGDKRREG